MQLSPNFRDYPLKSGCVPSGERVQPRDTESSGTPGAHFEAIRDLSLKAQQIWEAVSAASRDFSYRGDVELRKSFPFLMSI